MSASARISVEDAAKRLHLAPAKIAQAIKDGQWGFLGAHYIAPQTYVIPRAMFERWLAGELPIEWSAARQQPETAGTARDFWAA